VLDGLPELGRLSARRFLGAFAEHTGAARAGHNPQQAVVFKRWIGVAAKRAWLQGFAYCTRPPSHRIDERRLISFSHKASALATLRASHSLERMSTTGVATVTGSLAALAQSPMGAVLDPLMHQT
jgi:hypothetical protein